MANSNNPEEAGERLQNILARRGIASRRASAQLIQEGCVEVDGTTVTEPGTRVRPSATIRVKGRALPHEESTHRTFLFYKPVGVVASTDGQGAASVCSYFKRYRERLVPVGRLDKESEGLLLMSNDGALINQLTHPRYNHKKIYEVTLSTPCSGDALSRLQAPMRIDGYTIRPVKVVLATSTLLRFTLQEGRNRQIRKMCELVGLEITRLKRIQFSSLTLGDLEPGQFRELTPEEITALTRTNESATLRHTVHRIV